MYFENSIAIYVAIYPLEGGVDCLVDPYIDNHIHIPRYLVDSVKIYEKTRLRRKKQKEIHPLARDTELNKDLFYINIEESLDKETGTHLTHSDPLDTS